MKKKPRCPDCDKEMDPGFIPDFSYGTSAYSVLQTLWHPGKPKGKSFLGFMTGSVQFKKSAARKVVSYRCPSCGLLRNYAG